MFFPVVLASPLLRRQLLPLQQNELGRLNTQQVAENIFRVQTTDPGATYSSALIVLVPKMRTTAGDLAQLTQAVNNLGKQGAQIQQVQPGGQQIVPNQAGMSGMPNMPGMPNLPPVTPMALATNGTEQPQTTQRASKSASDARISAQEAFNGASKLA